MSNEARFARPHSTWRERLYLREVILITLE